MSFNCGMEIHFVMFYNKLVFRYLVASTVEIGWCSVGSLSLVLRGILDIRSRSTALSSYLLLRNEMKSQIHYRCCHNDHTLFRFLLAHDHVPPKVSDETEEEKRASKCSMERN